MANDGPRKDLPAIIDGAETELNGSNNFTKTFDSPIRSLYLTKSERQLIVGLESGEIKVLVQDPEYLRDRLQKKLIEIGIL